MRRDVMHGEAQALRQVVVPGCFGDGRTRAEALRQYRAALRLHLDELAARGGSLPIERRSPAVQVVVAA
jgi:predicted RNase H-like HicB family nuclease